MRTGKRAEPRTLLLTGLALVAFALLVVFACWEEALPGPFARLVPFGDWIVIASAAVLVGIAIASLHLMRRGQDSLAVFEEATRRLTSGDYSHRIHLTTRNEFHLLARAFNELTDQLEDTLKTSRSLADIDSLILSGANLASIVRKVILSAHLEGIETSLLLRPDMSALQVMSYRVEGLQVKQDVVSLFDMSEDALRDVDGYRQLADRLCRNDLLECYPVACEDRIAGALLASGNRPLTASESKRLMDLVDRLSVALTNIQRSENLYQQAHFDALTGLVNRRAFEDRLRESLARSHRGESGVLLFIDLDGFKKVNDTEGHEAGDKLLVIIAERLKEVLRPEDTIARIGGDEFAVMAPGCYDNKSVEVLCKRIITRMTQPIVVGRMEHCVGASIGVVTYPRDGQRLDELVMKADAAMYRAKEIGGSTLAFFDDSINEANRRRVLIENRLRIAIKARTLEVHFQPKLNLKTWTVRSAEALLRWRDEKLGDVDPTTFVGVAEETGLIHDIMPIVVDGAASVLESARLNGLELETVAINASPKQLMTEGFALSVLSLLDRRRLPHENIELEVTESVFARDMHRVVSELHILRMAGIRIALDDFGTGYSSLNMLRELPLDVVKIDRAFITELETSQRARDMVRHLVSIADSLGLDVVAEGVETDVQLDHLLKTDCDYIQGWFIARAMSAEDFIRVVMEWQSPSRDGRIKRHRSGLQ